ncbi:GUB_WAK_bind domain-containing protein/WAK_assoc domain-containing protein [Cephalotus follicularis]|uniref:non-specific serine/threonine protein kinase n=1 Tax=Cephalotus follicularis TaxID=3775 RepID=A0A1Q3D6J2_CEPFO|nr:GUB_WAK_bind domain-containing protein/WAK_assoc domain-containing protein [Cephalotus follicularis]
MKLDHSLSLFSFIYLVILPLISAQACQRTCGKLPINYPFGTGPFCGDPRFQQYVSCNQDKLTLTTQTGRYPVTKIDYANQAIYISDPSMSTCACTQPSKGFGLDWDAPFSFHDDNVFTLLDCSTTASPIFRSNNFDGNNSPTVPLCDRQGTPICSFLYSCTAISMLNLPISTCCVYTPVDLGPSFELDLQKLKCSSYSGFYSFSGQEANPENGQYGITLKYKFNVFNNYPSLCANCEMSNGACGYAEVYNAFVCNCPSGLNTTTDCYFGVSWNDGKRLLPWHRGTLILSLVWFVFRMIL